MLTSLTRRDWLKIGLAGFPFPQLMRLRAYAGTTGPRERTAIIALCCHGGISHIDTWDPKPLAPTEIRGEFATIDTVVPGMQVTEILPMHARIADKFSLLRSVSHTGQCHANGPQELWTGHHTDQQSWHPEHPDVFAIANRLRWEPRRDLPNYIGMTTSPWVTPVPGLGPAYLGERYAPFGITNPPSTDPKFRVGLDLGPNIDQLPKRRDLLQTLDQGPRAEKSRVMDEYQGQALDLLLGSRARSAFDLDQESAALRDRYGRTGWGQQCLLARRLVEAGVDLVTVSLYGAEAGGAANWDDHAVNAHIFQVLRARALNFDRCVTALIEDIFDRGLDGRVMVIVTGEFGRTPRVNTQVGTASKVPQPGRDHWPSAMSILFAGGGIAGGQVIGSTNKNGEYPQDRPLGVQDFLATIYCHLGIDAANIQLPDKTGRPTPILPRGAPIPELTAAANGYR